jgi:FkbM family methyltransferase
MPTASAISNISPIAEETPIRVKRCRHGLFMYNVNDEYVGRSLDVYGEFSELEANLFTLLVKPGMTVLDIGANIGAHTVGLTKMVTPSGTVIAFEPQRVIYQMLCGNVALNGLENVSTLMAALGKAPGSITVPPMNYRQRNNFGGIALGDFKAGEVVPLLTLDSFNLPRCDFIKLDVEGMEKDVLEGARQTLTKCNPIVYVENDRHDKSEALIRFLLEAGYRLYWHLPLLFNPDNYFKQSKNIFPTLASFNMLGIPRTRGHMVVKGYEEITSDNASVHPMANR